ncbi:hypothetical protein H6G81_28770 [Scytonema hofmannii FACHB-248]|uniref:Uncharacterized protein n=1 Tax=Scytonema hofmannii FACHB-248 TaxID=1842502 RepID=A0ABR8GYN5_9CYAN|nr:MULTISPECIES: hypothetical protein [Nostocales]MBD2608404.1 hypothetical protein [Scytonema hofmannii FACHB-248]
MTFVYFNRFKGLLVIAFGIVQQCHIIFSEVGVIAIALTLTSQLKNLAILASSEVFSYNLNNGYLTCPSLM